MLLQVNPDPAEQMGSEMQHYDEPWSSPMGSPATSFGQTRRPDLHGSMPVAGGRREANQNELRCCVTRRVHVHARTDTGEQQDMTWRDALYLTGGEK
jgi:hypothetical protein